MFHYLKRGREFYKTLFTLALPVALQNLINQSLALTDTAMLGMVGESELAAVTMANSPLLILLMIIFGFQSGSSILISQYWGKGDQRSINRVMGIGFYTCAALSFAGACVVTLFPRQVVSIWTNDVNLINLAAEYLRIAGFSYFINSFTLIYVAAQRSMENVKFGLYVQIVAMVVNTGLNYIFIFGKLGAPAMGVAGAALGTLCARIVELVIVILHAKFNKKFRIEWKPLLVPGRVITHDFIKYSSPVVMNELLWGIGMSVYPAIFGRLGESSVAAYTIAGNLDRILMVMIFGFANAAAVMIGKEIGQGNEEEAIDVGIAILLLSGIAGVLSGILLCLSRPLVYMIFSVTDQTQSLVSSMIIVLAVAMPFRAMFHSSVVGILRGGGDVTFGFLVDVLPLYFLAVPLAFVFAFVLHLSPVWVYACHAIEEFVKNIFATRRIMSRRWVRNLTRDI